MYKSPGPLFNMRILIQYIRGAASDSKFLTSSQQDVAGPWISSGQQGLGVLSSSAWSESASSPPHPHLHTPFWRRDDRGSGRHISTSLTSHWPNTASPGSFHPNWVTMCPIKSWQWVGVECGLNSANQLKGRRGKMTVGRIWRFLP